MPLPQEVQDKEVVLQAALTDIAVEQEAFKSLNGKYKQYTSFNGDADVFVHEYVSPLGAGYRVYAKVGNWLKCVDAGTEGSSFDWVQVGIA